MKDLTATPHALLIRWDVEEAGYPAQWEGSRLLWAYACLMSSSFRIASRASRASSMQLKA